MIKTPEPLIAGKTIDDWFKDDKSIIYDEKATKRRFYNKKIVAFLDLLAMKDLIFSNNKSPGDEEEPLDKIYKIHNIVERVTSLLVKSEDFSLLNISDSFIFTCAATDIVLLLKLLATIQLRILVECKFQLRGAVTFGDVHVSEEGKQIIGPAYIDAYLMQEKNAIYPRIILGDSLLIETKEIYNNSTNLISGEDGEKFIDYLGYYLQNEKNQKTNIILNMRRENVFSFLEDQYNIHNKNNNCSVKQKYGWTIQYFKSKGVWPNGK